MSAGRKKERWYQTGKKRGKIRDSEMEISVTRGVICDPDTARQTVATTVEVLSIALRLGCFTG